MTIILTKNEILATAKTVGNLPFIKRLMVSDDKIVEKFFDNLVKETAETKAVTVRNFGDEIRIEIEEEFMVDILELGGDIVKGLFSIAMGLKPMVDKLNKKWHSPETVFDDRNQSSYYKTTSNSHTPITFMKHTELVVDNRVIIGVMINHRDNSISAIPTYIPFANQSLYRVKVDENEQLKFAEKTADWTWSGEWTGIDSMPVGDRSFHFFNSEEDLKEFIINWQ